MMMMMNGETIRTLVDKLPAEAFDYIAEEFPYLFERNPEVCEYIHFEPTFDGHTADNVAEDYGYDSLDAWMEDDYAPYIVTMDYDEPGLLILE